VVLLGKYESTLPEIFVLETDCFVTSVKKLYLLIFKKKRTAKPFLRTMSDE
jgi:hypothetical protein